MRDSGEAVIDRQAFISNIVRGQRRGLLPTLARGGLRVASWAFGAGARARGALYDAGVLAAHRAPVRTISIGNLTTGGTGKTPLVIELAQRLVARGERVAVLARNYGAAPGQLNDELALVHAKVPEARLYPGSDRVASAERAAREGATVLLLDDGFQHRRLARDVDVLTIDATDPWGAGALLPRGLLREPVSAARRATHVVITRVEQVGAARVDEIKATLARAGVRAPVALMRLRAVAPELPARVVALSAIGNPDAFERTIADAGATVARSIRRADHHAYTLDDVAGAVLCAREAGALAIVVTEKDHVKLAPLLADRTAADRTAASGPPEVPFVVLAIEPILESMDELSAAIASPLVEAVR